MPSIEEMKDAYQNNKNLKVAADLLGMKFQTLYWNLKKAGVSCTGDKECYGSRKDIFGAKAESEFARIIPYAEDQNKVSYQPPIDFLVRGIKVEIKAAKRQCLGVGAGQDRWSFSIKKQIEDADFFVCFAFSKDEEVEAIFLIPAVVIASKTTISVSCKGRSKWYYYMVSEAELKSIFNDLAII
jgi:hypothetical protein